MKKYLFIALLINIFGCEKTINDKSILKNNIEPPSSFTATSSDYQTNPIKPNSIIFGYLIDGYLPTDDQYKNMTHIGISFLRATNVNGDIAMTSGWENIDEVIASAQKNNVKAIISFGGGDYKITSELMGVKANRKNLIKNIIRFMRKYNLDGFDCDWEPSWIDNKTEMESVNNAITHHYIKFIRDLRISIDNEFGKGKKSFSAAVMNRNNIWYSSWKQIAHFPQNGWWHYLDWVALMNYDNDIGEKHASYHSVYGENGSISHWTEFGIPKEKIVTGIPFYARAGWGKEWLFYKDIVKMNPGLSYDVDFISYKKNNSGVKTYGFNGRSTVSKKIIENKNLKLPGMMFWQLAGDMPITNEYSLLKVINGEMGLNSREKMAH
tara:strand:- start:161 stop:1300 length:1140 start_codon:yes stop_codon:yes gene_type:complete